MGTHNALIRLGSAAYLEVIAPDPSALPPDRPRWYELDRLRPDAGPKLATWVARTDDVFSTTAACKAEFGKIEPMSRGSLEWLITIPPGGRSVADGAVPMLIQWLVNEHPAAKLPDSRCRLIRMTIFHPERDRVRGVLDCLGLGTGAITLELPADGRPYLVADIETPAGPRSIGGPPT